MQIDGLNQEQVEMLDKLWSLNTLEEVEQFRSGLPLFRRQQVDTLMEMLYQEACEEALQKVDAYPDTVELFKRLGIKTG
jgi:hypothetical protein